MADYTHPAGRAIHTTTTINAPASVVYRILTDFASYHEWSSFLQSVQPVDPQGDPLALGTKLKVSILPPGDTSPMGFTSTVVLSTPPTAFAWLGGIQYLYLGKHMFLLSPLKDDAGKTELIHREEFSGVLFTPVMSWMGVGEKTRRGFERFNEELKGRAEREVAGI